MKNIYKISQLSILILLVYSFTSCEKDFLDKNPLDSVASQGFWKTKADVETGLAGVYSRLQQNFLGYERIYFEGLTDNAYCATNFNLLPFAAASSYNALKCASSFDMVV